MEGLGINLTLLVAQIFNFTLLLVILRGVAYKPMIKFLDGRREKIAKGLEDARRAEERLANIEKDYQSRMDAARADAQKMVAEMTANAEKNAAAIAAKANEDVAKIKTTAQEEAEAERNKALADLRSQVVTLSMAAAHKLIGEAMDEKRQRALVDEFFSGVKAGKVVLLEEGAGGAGKAEVTSALPLSADEQATIKGDLTGRGASEVAFKVDPRILGGLVVRMGDRVVDASVSGQLESLKQSLS
ncbi:ATP synthase subunit b [Thermoflexales bacterium]|nr:ATP synthase subunit b [Thermoflexales bacterium]